MPSPMLRICPKQDGVPTPTRAGDVTPLSALLAVEVVVWAYFFHIRILGEEDLSLRGPLLLSSAWPGSCPWRCWDWPS